MIPSALAPQIGCLNPQRLEQTRAQIVQQGLARDLLHDGRQHEGGRRVVSEVRAGLVRHRMIQKHLGCQFAREPNRFFLMSGGHAQQIADAHRLQVGARLRRRDVGKELENRVVHGEFAFGHGQANRRRSETLA